MGLLRAFPTSDGRLRFFEDFVARPPYDGWTNWDFEMFGFACSGTAASVAETSVGVSTTNKARGVLNMLSGTDTNSRAGFATAPAAFIAANGDLEVRMRLFVSALSTSGQEYSLVAGFHDNLINSTLNPVDGAWFRYHRAVDGDFWVCCTAAASDADPTSPTNFTKTVTAVAPSISSGRMQRLTIKLRNAGTVAEFYIDGVLVATHATNGPAANATCLGARILKSVGATSRSVYVDYVDLYTPDDVGTR